MIRSRPRRRQAVDIGKLHEALLLHGIVNVIRRRPLPFHAVFGAFTRFLGFQLGSAFEEIPHFFPNVGRLQSALDFVVLSE